MAGSVKSFGSLAKGLSRNPLGIIALFIILVYGFACLVVGLTGNFTSAERLPLVYFLVVFPVLVLGVFFRLVSRHSNKLFGPSDFKNQRHYVELQQTQLSVAASLGAAAAKTGSLSDSQLQRIGELARAVPPSKFTVTEGWSGHLLWVDDHPDNNVHERQAFEAIGLHFTLAISTDEALQCLQSTHFVTILSDMSRREGPREGYRLLDLLRKQNTITPFFIYAGSNAPEHQREIIEHGGQGCTNNPQELFEMVRKVIFGQVVR